MDLNDPSQREFGDYELLEQIGQGGMGVVYRARQKHLERDVALKLLSAGPWAAEEFITAFRREARNAASLQHPNIVTVYEMGEHDGLIFYAMQLIVGESLAQRMERGALPAREAAALVRTVAEAVDYGHRLGVLHLDLKPGNILLAEDGIAKVTDFGMARRLGQAASLENEQVSGTPSYMAPEQAQVRGPPLSAATDIWGLGAVLYELLAGRPPFTGDVPWAILQQVLSGVVPSPAASAAQDRDLWAICLRCLRSAPEQRYGSARELADDLGRYLEGRAVLARPLNLLQRAARWTRREPKFASATVLAIMVLVAGLLATTQQWRRAQSHAMTASERLWEGRREAALRLAAEGEGWQAMPKLLANVMELEQAGLNDAAMLDRRRIGQLLQHGATLIDTMAIADANPLAAAISDDGSRLALALSDQTVRWYDSATLLELGRVSLRGRISSGGQARSIVLLRFVGNDMVRATLEWYRTQVHPNDADTWLLDLKLASIVEVPDGFEDFSDAIYSADGSLALLRTRSGQVQFWRVSPWTPESAPIALQSTAMAWMIMPKAGHALAFDAAMEMLHVYTLPDLRQVRSLKVPREAGFSAWAASPDGEYAALGDIEGRVRLFTLGSGQMRSLPSTRGREVSWLAFSEDGAWLAVGNVDGRVHAYAADSGDALVSGSLEHDFPIRRVEISRERRLLIAVGEGRTALWRIPAASGPRALPPIRVATAPASSGQAGPYASGWSWRTGLFVSAGIDGQVRLWRLPDSPTLELKTPPQIPERFQVANVHAIDVEWNRLRLVRLDSHETSDWLTLAQPPGYAELAGDGRTLVVTVGPRLHVYDVPSLQLRAAPVELPSSPQRLLLSSDGRYALFDFGVCLASGFGARLYRYSLTSPRRLPGQVTLPGPLLMLVESPDGKYIVAVGPASGTTTVLETQSLAVIGEFPHDPFQPVIAADFALDDPHVLLVTRATDPRFGVDALLLWDPITDLVIKRHATGGARPYGVIALKDGAFLPGEIEHLRYERDDFRRIVRPMNAFDTAMGAYAASPDRRFLALASRLAVMLYSSDGEQLGGPVRIDTPTGDGIAKVAFSSDGTQLLVRTIWQVVRWSIAPEQRPSEDLDTLLSSLAEETRFPQALRVPALAHRVILRDRDPGGWREAVPERSMPDIGGYSRFDGAPIPARAPDTPDELLDLTSLYTSAPDSRRNSYISARPFLRPIPSGVQRLGEVDFDLRGMVEIGPDGFFECVQTPEGQPLAAVHALLVPTVRTGEDRPRLLAEMVLYFEDGGQARIPIRATVEVQGFGSNDRLVPQVFSPAAVSAAIGFRSVTLAAPRLANPEPERPVRCVDIETTGDSMLVLGLTVEPVISRVRSDRSSGGWDVHRK